MEMEYCLKLPLVPYIMYTSPGSSVCRVSALGTGGRRFDPKLPHTKVIKNGTSCSALGTQTDGVEL